MIDGVLVKKDNNTYIAAKIKNLLHRQTQIFQSWPYRYTIVQDEIEIYNPIFDLNDTMFVASLDAKKKDAICKDFAILDACFIHREHLSLYAIAYNLDLYCTQEPVTTFWDRTLQELRDYTNIAIPYLMQYDVVKSSYADALVVAEEIYSLLDKYEAWDYVSVKQVKYQGDIIIKNFAVQFSNDAKSGKYNNLSDDDYKALLEFVKSLSRAFDDMPNITLCFLAKELVETNSVNQYIDDMKDYFENSGYLVGDD